MLSEAAHPAAKKKHVLLIRGLLLFVMAAILGMVTFHPFFVYQSYQQGRCTVQSEHIQSGQTKGSTYYTPSFEYLVQTKDGRHVLASGYDTPGEQRYSSYSEAQQVVDSYVVGGTYNCWYNPADPTRAALVFHGETLDYAIGSYIAITPILFFALILTFVLLYYGVSPALRLLIKGVHTQGQVTEHFMRSEYTRDRQRVERAYSRIVFHLQSDPPHSQFLEVEEPGTYPIGSQQPVWYDPSNPKNTRQGGRETGCVLAFALALSILPLALILFVLLIFWFSS